MPDATPWFAVRQLQKGDTRAVQQLFKDGMLETVVPGVLRELARHSSGRPAALAAGMLGIGALAGRPAVAAGVGLATAALAVASSQFVARRYIAQSLRNDMADPVQHYVLNERNNFFVATRKVDGQVVGTVAVEGVTPRAQAQAKRRKEPHRWSEGDAELRRMSVQLEARGRGVAEALCEAVQRHARDQGYSRVVLSTSSMQAQAARRLYPRMGYEVVHRARMMGDVEVFYMARAP
jgi:GNAT superfamily N-acetyltransferase